MLQDYLFSPSLEYTVCSSLGIVSHASKPWNSCLVWLWELCRMWWSLFLAAGILVVQGWSQLFSDLFTFSKSKLHSENTTLSAAFIAGRHWGMFSPYIQLRFILPDSLFANFRPSPVWKFHVPGPTDTVSVIYWLCLILCPKISFRCIYGTFFNIFILPSFYVQWLSTLVVFFVFKLDAIPYQRFRTLKETVLNVMYGFPNKLIWMEFTSSKICYNWLSSSTVCNSCVTMMSQEFFH